MKVHEIMSRPVHTVRTDTPLKQAAELMAEHRVSGLPVLDDQRRVVGIITEGDFLRREVVRGFPRGRRMAEGGHGYTVADVMTREVVTVEPDAPVGEAAQGMMTRGVRQLPVADREGYLVGIVSRGDLLRTFLRADGAIADEISRLVLQEALRLDDRSVQVTVADGVVRLRGTVPTRTDAHMLHELVSRVEGVVGVESLVSWDLDDAPGAANG